MVIETRRPKRPGGRSARNRAAVHRAAEEILAEGGLAALTVSAVAERSGVHHTSIYRRWGDLRGLLFDVILEFAVTATPDVDTGSLRCDLHRYALAAAESLESPAKGALIQALFSLPLDDDGQSRRQYWERRHATLRPIFDRARLRGEHTDSPEDVIEAVLAPLYFRRFVYARPIDDAFLHRVVDQALEFFRRVPPPSPEHTPSPEHPPGCAHDDGGSPPANGLPAKVPTSDRGKQTRAELLSAARAVFEADGYTDSRIVDIAARAGMSAGTFYTYFTDKEHILEAVLRDAQQEALDAADFAHVSGSDSAPEAVLRDGITAYFDQYSQNHRLMLLIEQVAGIDPSFRDGRRARELSLHDRNAAMIRDWRETGLACFSTDPFLTVSALSGMINRLGYNHLAIRHDADVASIVNTAVSLWISALGIERRL